LKGFYWVLAAVALAGIAFLAYSLFRADRAATEPIELTNVEDARALLARAEGIKVGPDTAPARVVVFSDYQCPACGEFARQIGPWIQENFVDDGRAQVIFYDFPLGGTHIHSFLAARAARCAADQGRFWEYHDILFARVMEWSPSREAPLEQFVRYAGDLGLNRKAFEDCLESDRHADAVTANRMLGDQLGVNATPTVIVNGRRVYNPFDRDELRAAIVAEQPAGAEAAS